MLLKYKSKIIKQFTPQLSEFYDILVCSNECHIGETFSKYLNLTFDNLDEQEIDVELIKKAIKVTIDFPK